MADAPEFTVERLPGGDDRASFRLAGELDIDSAPTLWSALDAALDVGIVRMALDLTDVGFIDSSGLGVLVRLGKQCSAAGGAVSLHAPSERVRQLLEITKLDTVFDLT